MTVRRLAATALVCVPIGFGIGIAIAVAAAGVARQLDRRRYCRH